MSQAPRDRGATPVVGTILLVAAAFVIAASLLVVGGNIADKVREPAPAVVVEASFDARYTPEPHWSFNLTHVGGDNIAPGEMRITMTDNFGNSGSVVHAGPFSSGDRIRVGFWGSPSRAANCVVAPDTAPGAGNDQLVGSTPPASSVRIAVVHEPSAAVMDTVTVDLGDFPSRFGTRLVDGSQPSIGCDDYDWT